MSSTRHASSGSPLRQERYCSRPEFNLGLMANLVAKRCRVLPALQDRQLVWFLQWISHQEGGLARLASDLVSMFQDRVGTESVRKIRLRRGKSVTTEQARLLRNEILGGSIGPARFPLRGESDEADATAPRSATAEDTRPAYDGGDFIDALQEGLEQLPELLASMCLDPSRPLEGYKPRHFPSLVPSLHEFRTGWIARKSGPFVETHVSKRIFAALDYGLESRCLVLADGPSRTGKTYAVKEWVRRKAGMARYVQVPPTNDRKSFFRHIAASLGVSINLNSKPSELEERVEQTLHGGDLALILDEAHYLWQQSTRPSSKADRINWLMVELVNFDVPVALITTPQQFYPAQRQMERATGWSSEQFIGRIGLVERLPKRLEWNDLLAVAEASLPEATQKSARVLAAYAERSARHLASIEAIAKRARYLAAKAGRSGVSERDVWQAVNDTIIPSDKALATALAEPSNSRRRAVRNPVGIPPASPVQGRFEGHDTAMMPAPDREASRPDCLLDGLNDSASGGQERALLVTG